ncbi:MAG: cell division protein FtsQ/DivIB [Lawsonibacter sp.]|jgi:cell division protein FtsQ
MASARNNRRHRRNRGRFGPLFKLLCILAVVVALTMGATVFFQVETVVVTGNSRYTQEQVIEASGIAIGDNLYHMNKFHAAQQIRESLPYIGEVSIRRSLPSTIVITVTEWDAVARVEAPDPAQIAEELALEDGEDLEAGEAAASDSEADGSSSQMDGGVEVADEAWLISVGGKLLEPAPEGKEAISVTGITPIMPRAGTLLSLPQSEQGQLQALLSLLSGLEELGMLEETDSIQLSPTQVVMGYQGRFSVKIPLNADFSYKLSVLRESVVEAEKKLGDGIRGTFDLTQEDVAAIFTPE